jgi:hypothetical protein
MSKNNDKNNNQPLDDLGIKNDQLINCAERIVDEVWNRLNLENEKIPANDLHAYSATLCNVWSLVRSMMEFLEEGYDDMEGYNFKDESGELDDDDDDDDDDEEDDNTGSEKK